MKQFYYTLRYLIHGKGNSLIKILSLSLGLLVSIVLFARVAFEMGFDKFYPENDRLHTIMCLYTIGGDSWEPVSVVHGPMPSTFNEEIPEIKYATVTRRFPSEKAFMYEDKKYMPETFWADSLYFKTMGIRVLQGDDRLLGVQSNVFISQKQARNMFGNEDPIGKVLRADNNELYTIQGVFEDIPENCHQRFDVLISLVIPNIPELWMNDDSYSGYVRLHDHVDPDQIEEKIRMIIAKSRDEEMRIAQGVTSRYYLLPVGEIHSGDGTVKRMCLILSLLAFSILLIAAMNYILISISSLAGRAKTVGIHKCNGASSHKIFSMFLYETGVLILISLVIAVLLLLGFRGFIEDITNTSFKGLFQYTSLWIPFVLIAVIFFISGYAPARILSSVPVTQVFRTVTVNKRYWKRFLLFIQFSGITFILILLVIILSQYKMIMDKDLGYDSEGIVYTSLNVQADSYEEWASKMEAAGQEFQRLSYVVGASNHANDLTGGYGGTPICDENKNVLFSSRVNIVDFNYIPVMKMDMVAGENFTAEDQLIVNETYVRMMGWEKEEAIGKVVFSSNSESYGTITGVVKDFPVNSLYVEQVPVLLFAKRQWGRMLTLRIADFSSDKLTQLNEKMAIMFPDQIKEFTVLQNVLNAQYVSTRQFRDSVIAAFLIVLLITAMGLFGYISDEITRRSKEIAIRKVNGATADTILSLLYKDISYLSVPAVISGAVIAIFLGRKWLEDFAVKITLSPQLFIGSGVVILFIILMIVTIRTWKVANENPVESIKSE